MIFASIAGVWLFSVQHRSEGSEWLRQTDWTSVRAALSGRFYLKLPGILHRFTGNIGFHHVHPQGSSRPQLLLERVPSGATSQWTQCPDGDVSSRVTRAKLLTLG
jgi:acyl-lipid omega-6 desaturase (Delta-12 desaturase)